MDSPGAQSSMALPTLKRRAVSARTAGATPLELFLRRKNHVPVAKTKIVATVGPACGSNQMLTELIDGGADVLRIDFSHGDHAQYLQFIQNARGAAQL